jgi:hypothetical protein
MRRLGANHHHHHQQQQQQQSEGQAPRDLQPQLQQQPIAQEEGQEAEQQENMQGVEEAAVMQKWQQLQLKPRAAVAAAGVGSRTGSRMPLSSVGNLPEVPAAAAAAAGVPGTQQQKTCVQDPGAALAAAMPGEAAANGDDIAQDAATLDVDDVAAAPSAAQAAAAAAGAATAEAPGHTENAAAAAATAPAPGTVNAAAVQDDKTAAAAAATAAAAAAAAALSAPAGADDPSFAEFTVQLMLHLGDSWQQIDAAESKLMVAATNAAAAAVAPSAAVG